MGANADKEKKEDDMEVDTEAPTETEKTEKTEKTATEAKETTAQTAIEGKEGKPAVAQVWGEDEEERPRKVTYAALKERFGEYFMPEEDLAKAMKAIGLAHADETAMADDEEAAQPLTSISPEVEWLAELPELMEDVTPTATLKIQGMRLPFSRMLLKKSLERPSKFNEAVCRFFFWTKRVSSKIFFLTACGWRNVPGRVGYGVRDVSQRRYCKETVPQGGRHAMAKDTRCATSAGELCAGRGRCGLRGGT